MEFESKEEELILLLTGNRLIDKTQRSLLYIEAEKLVIQNARDIIRFGGDITVRFERNKAIHLYDPFEKNATCILFRDEPKGLGLLDSGISDYWLSFIRIHMLEDKHFLLIGVDYRKNGGVGPFSRNPTLTTWVFPKYEKSLSHSKGEKGLNDD